MTKVGDIIEGTVNEIFDWGLIVNDSDGKRSILHKSDLWWDRRGRHPSDYASIGDKVVFMVTGIGSGEFPNLVGSPKQAFPERDLWRSDKTKVGDLIEGTVMTVADYGLFVDDANGIDYLLGLHELWWDSKGIPSDFASIGDKVLFIVTKIDPVGRTRLGSPKLAHPDQNPWRDPSVYSVGGKFSAEIIQVVEYGAFVKHPMGAEGLLHIDSFPDGSTISIGEILDFVIVESDVESRRIQVKID